MATKKYSSSKSNKSKAYKKAALILVPLVVVGLSIALLAHQSSTSKTAKTTQPKQVSPAGSIDYSPAKPSDNAANEARKSQPGAQPKEASDGTNTQAAPTPFSATISRANGQGQNITVAAIVNGASSGTCTFNFSQSANGAIVKRYSEPVSAANQSYSCSQATVAMPSGGDWYVSLSVASSGSEANNQWAANPVKL